MTISIKQTLAYLAMIGLAITLTACEGGSGGGAGMGNQPSNLSSLSTLK